MADTGGNPTEAVQMHVLSDERIDKDIRKYESLLGGKAPESSIQAFLASHVYFFNCIARHHTPIFSRVKLGSNFEADFAFFDPSSFGAEWNFVEIESPTKQLFTKTGNQSAALTHAVQQVRDWKRWIAEQLTYARELMPLIKYPFFYVFMGRRCDLTEKTWEKLQQLNYETRMWLEIGTLDRFVSGANSAKALAHQQLRAYSHAEMARSEPRASFDWLRSHHAELYKQRKEAFMLEERAGDADAAYPPD